MENPKKALYEENKYTIMIKVDHNMAPLQKRNSPKIYGVDEDKIRIERGKKMLTYGQKENYFQ